MDYPYVRSSSKRRVAVDGVYVVNSSWVETGRLTSPCTACWNKIRSWVGWTFLDVKKSKKSYPSFSQGMLLLCSPIKGKISVVFRNQGIQFGLKIHHGVERSVKEQRNMLIYWLFDWLVIASSETTYLSRFKKPSYKSNQSLHQLGEDSLHWLFGIVRQCLRSPANCDRHHIHSNLRASLNSVKWSFRIHLSIPWCQKLQQLASHFTDATPIGLNWRGI